MLKKRIIYLRKAWVVDIIILIPLFVCLQSFCFRFFETRRENHNLFGYGMGLSLFWVYAYLMKYFLRPVYDYVSNKYKKGYKISGYYSGRSMESPETYYVSYEAWVKYNLAFIIIEMLVMLAFCAVKAWFMDSNMFTLHFILMLMVQVVAWVLTGIRERRPV